jgi:hypothetical protein
MEKRERGAENQLMKNSRAILDLRRKKALRIGILILMTLIITAASALVYARMVYETALDVGNTRGVTIGSSSPASGGVSFTPATIVMLAVSGLVVGLSIFVFLRESSKHISNISGGRGSSSKGPVSVSLEVPGISLPSHLPSTGGEEWEESPRREEESSASSSG